MNYYRMNYYRLPEHMQEGARAYVEQGRPPGDFLHAVLTDSLTEAFARADRINTHAMRAWAQWLHADCPRPAWGSPTAVQKWIERGGLEGRRAPATLETDGTPPNAAERTAARRVDPA